MSSNKLQSRQKRTSEVHDLPSALDHFKEILQITRDYSAILCLDYDGTLTPIVDDPEKAVISDEMREQVRETAKKIPVAIVSGRGLDFIKNQLQMDDVYYAGSHGFEISGPGDFHHEHEEARDALPVLDKLEERLREDLGSIEGATVERKKFGLAIHYRKVKPEDVDLVKQKIDGAMEGVEGLKKGRGKKVIELKPDLEWDKGRAVDFISKRISKGGKAEAAIYIGDDITDEDAFQEISRGAGILVGSHDEDSAADYGLENVEEVKEFLKKFTENL